MSEPRRFIAQRVGGDLGHPELWVAWADWDSDLRSFGETPGDAIDSVVWKTSQELFRA